MTRIYNFEIYAWLCLYLKKILFSFLSFFKLLRKTSEDDMNFFFLFNINSKL